MTQAQRLDTLIEGLLKERPETPGSKEEKWRLFRGLVNTRPPWPAGEEFLSVQDAYLQEEIRAKGITRAEGLPLTREGFRLWQGDITTLEADGIVNAANSRLLGCWQPCHECIDNAIHTYAGVQLRLACAELMRRQGAEEPAGRAKITPAFNLPSRYVLHTVGPIVAGPLRREDRDTLEQCYRSCLRLADENRLRTLAFCCISTGVFRFPPEEAARAAVSAVRQYIEETHSSIQVIFNVFLPSDYDIYRKLLGVG